MNETKKTLLAMLLILSTIPMILSWSYSKPDSTILLYRACSPLVAIWAIFYFIKLHFKKDISPDFLIKIFKNYYNSDGFCFNFMIDKEKQFGFIIIYYQNQYDQPCKSKINLQQKNKLFRSASDLEPINFIIECGAGEFGYQRIPFVAPEKMQGKHVTYIVNADTTYKQSAKTQLRFKHGIPIRSNAGIKKFINLFYAASEKVVSFSLTSSLVTIKLKIPTEINEFYNNNKTKGSKILWQRNQTPN